jgi:hypothetical protein
VLAVFAGWYLPNDPETAKFLTEEERRVAVGRLAKGIVYNEKSSKWIPFTNQSTLYQKMLELQTIILGHGRK